MGDRAADRGRGRRNSRRVLRLYDETGSARETGGTIPGPLQVPAEQMVL